MVTSKISPEIWAIVLAAGESSRMNGPKLVLPFGNGTVISSVISGIPDSCISGIVVVTGAWEMEVLGAVSGFNVITCRNEFYKSGMLSSVICGIEKLPENADAAIVFQGDQPGISPLVISEMATAFGRTGKGLILPEYNGKRGHPLLIARSYFLKVKELDHRTGLRGILTEYSFDIHEVVVKDSYILHDIDTMKDYGEYLKRQ
ncbi:MAG TPA: nucleotidyltransferase family protein [Bacteroidales bacterium]|nr:nucleotidyltransferase family protein [Bacteroidales bacterium]